MARARDKLQLCTARAATATCSYALSPLYATASARQLLARYSGTASLVHKRLPWLSSTLLPPSRAQLQIELEAQVLSGS